MEKPLDDKNNEISLSEEETLDLPVDFTNVIGCLKFIIPKIFLYTLAVIGLIMLWFITCVISIYILLLPISNAVHKESYNMTTGCSFTSSNCSENIPCYYSKVSRECFGWSNLAALSLWSAIIIIAFWIGVCWNSYSSKIKREKILHKEI